MLAKEIGRAKNPKEGVSCGCRRKRFRISIKCNYINWDVCPKYCSQRAGPKV